MMESKFILIGAHVKFAVYYDHSTVDLENNGALAYTLLPIGGDNSIPRVVIHSKK